MSRRLALYTEAASRSVPLEVMIELTHRCNFRCQHCYIPDFAAPDLLPTARLMSLLDELVEMGTLVLALSGGEPTLRRDWLAIARRGRELGFDEHLFTNGFRIGDAEAAAIAELHATVHVSYYTRDEEVFDTITRRKGSYRLVTAGVERLRARGCRVVLTMPLMPFNYRHTAAVRAWADEIGATCSVSPLITARKDGDLTPLQLRVDPALLTAEVGGPVLGCHPKGLSGPLCSAASRYCCITSAGDVMACNILPGSGGNILDRPFREVWETSPWLNQVRNIRARDLPTCSSCSRLSYCGRCHAQALAEDGDLYGPSTYARQRAELIEACGSPAAK